MALAAVPFSGEKFKDAESATRQALSKAEIIIRRDDPEIMKVDHLLSMTLHAQEKTN